MTAVTTLPFGRPLTRDDLDGLPDDGHRYELIDGVLVVSPSPRPRHQLLVGALYRTLHAVCPPHLAVLLGPVDVVLARDTVLVPDLIVAPRGQFTERDLPGAPLLSIEVLSPSTRRFDQLVKRDRLQTAGVGAYWLIDPDRPAITVLELQGLALVESASVTGDELLEVAFPFPLRVRPSELLG
jgi:Uma2 family endonuclease